MLPFAGLYSRKHLDTLVELVHETLKTLDTAAAKYGNPAADKKKKKKDKVRRAFKCSVMMKSVVS